MARARGAASKVLLAVVVVAAAAVAPSLDDLVIAGPAFVTCGRDEQEMAIAIQGTKSQIAFYGSTPSYRAVFEVQGWGELQGELNRLVREDRWSEMGGLIDDEVLHAFSAVGTPAEVARQLSDRWDGIAERITLYFNYPATPELQLEIVEALRSGA